MQIASFLGLLAAILPVAYGAPVDVAETLHPDILAAMKRDLGLDATQATARVAREISAVEVIDALKTSTGPAFAGAWVANDGATINVAVTDAAVAGREEECDAARAELCKARAHALREARGDRLFVVAVRRRNRLRRVRVREQEVEPLRAVSSSGRRTE